MIFCKYVKDGKVCEDLFHTHLDLFRATFSPNIEVVSTIEFKASGYTYQDRRSCVEEIAKEFQTADEGGLSYEELLNIQQWFEKMGRRYGLYREFRTNGVI